MTTVYVDGDACPVRDEVLRVVDRLELKAYIVTNGSRPILPPRSPNASLIFVGQEPDAADNWIAERIATADICVTGDIPLAGRCLAKGALALSPHGHIWTDDNIGSALAGRDISRHLREIGETTSGPAPFTKADRSRFLDVLNRLVETARRGAS
ncbi:MAG TPA: YaiI/YqxD family protein [Alphaproteobacteria bacterium]|nr:YaiI/YqxD family protein [Alphaproteobacteria bacterium]